MPMTLLDAPEYDSRKARRRRILGIILAVVVVLAIVGVLYWPRYIARHTVDRFFEALEHRNYQEAYYIWQADPKLYSMDAFMHDWGPASQWGVIKSYKINQLGPPPGGHANGLVALVTVNGIAGNQQEIWISDGTHALSFYMF